MKKQKVVTLDLSGCQSLGEIHQRIKKAFDFPDFYGENWDAFEDMIRNECDAEKIEILGECTLSEEMQPSMQIMHDILKLAKEESEKYGWKFDYHIVN
ncbi:MAG TPA: barstar family protein [Candidatus Gallacutalibacter stercoravium]|nr:barstar family protein [Candidatus Gallacutalibacter stercoravium]